MTESAAASYCRNCSLFLGASPGNYCPNCGQDTAAHPPTAWEFLHEFVGHYAAIEGRLTRTLGLLIFRPGELTRRYLAGKKKSYVLPLRLYLTASILFFLLVKIFGAGNLVKNEIDTKSADKVFVLSEKSGRLAGDSAKGLRVGKPGSLAVSPAVTDEDVKRALDKPFLDQIDCEFLPVQCNKIKAHLKDKYQDQTRLQVGRQVRDRTVSLAPYAMFVCLPVFAFFTMLLYFNRKLYYGEHLVYAFHVHSFAFLLLLAIALAPEALGDWLYVGGAVYFWMAMRKVFGGRWLPTFLRYAVISLLYPVLLALVVAATLMAAIFV